MHTLTSTSTPSRRSRRRIGVLAALAGAVLLVGGTTYALWTDDSLQAGGVITNGNLDIASQGAVTYWDVSPGDPDRTSTTPITGIDAHAVTDVGAYRIVPGDVLEANYGFAAALSGDNVVAGLTVLFPDARPIPGVTFSAQAYYFTGSGWTPVGTPTTVVPGGTEIDLGLFQSANQLNGDLAPGIPVVTLADITSQSSPNVTVVVTTTFDSAVSGQTSMDLATTVGDVTLRLAQTRTPAAEALD